MENRGVVLSKGIAEKANTWTKIEEAREELKERARERRGQEATGPISRAVRIRCEMSSHGESNSVQTSNGPRHHGRAWAC